MFKLLVVTLWLFNFAFCLKILTPPLRINTNLMVNDPGYDYLYQKIKNKPLVEEYYKKFQESSMTSKELNSLNSSPDIKPNYLITGILIFPIILFLLRSFLKKTPEVRNSYKSESNLNFTQEIISKNQSKITIVDSGPVSNMENEEKVKKEQEVAFKLAEERSKADQAEARKLAEELIINERRLKEQEEKVKKEQEAAFKLAEERSKSDQVEARKLAEELKDKEKFGRESYENALKMAKDKTSRLINERRLEAKKYKESTIITKKVSTDINTLPDISSKKSTNKNSPSNKREVHNTFNYLDPQESSLSIPLNQEKTKINLNKLAKSSKSLKKLKSDKVFDIKNDKDKFLSFESSLDSEFKNITTKVLICMLLFLFLF